MLHSAAPLPFKWIWKSCVLPKHKFFFWLLLQDRLNTRDLLTRKNFYVESKACVLCDDCPTEDLCHLFFKCDFNQTFWWSMNIEWNTDLSLIDLLIDGRNRIKLDFFKEVLIIGCWTIWNDRNKIIFEGEVTSHNECKRLFKECFYLVRIRAKPSLKDGMSQWVDTL